MQNKHTRKKYSTSEVVDTLIFFVKLDQNYHVPVQR